MKYLAIEDALRAEFAGAITQLQPDEKFEADKVLLTVATKPEFGDYQCNQAMPLAKTLRQKPRDIAEKIVANLTDSGLGLEIAGPGFINITLNNTFIETVLKNQFASGNFGIQKDGEAKTVIVDYSSPNIAKEMHVGHLRSTIIGESVARILELAGHKVERVNHLGDWGTQFGMLIHYLKETHPDFQANPVDISDLVGFYKAAKGRFDEDEDFKTQARLEVTKLQSGDEENLKAWRYLCKVSSEAFQEIYDLLGVNLIERGESFYNPFLPGIIDELKEKNILEMSDGAACVFVEGMVNREGDRLPMIVQKSDGGFTYDTTDLAALRYRIKEQAADWIIYVTDKGQSSHFKQVFAAGEMAGWVENQRLDHIGFGLVLGEDKKKFKTRSGETVKLKDLLGEAIERELALTKKKNPEMADEDVQTIARTLGLGAVKYADLSQNRESDYVFSYDKMLQLQGNTAPYLINAYVRIRSILRKAAEQDYTFNEGNFEIGDATERALMVHLCKYNVLHRSLLEDFGTQHLAEYLFELCQHLNRFYKQCSVLNADTPKIRSSRLALIDYVSQTIRSGLELLGLDVLERM